MCGANVTANVYVDGFNLYNGALRRKPYRWLDLHALVRNLVSAPNIGRIRYYTARVRNTATDPGKQARQAQYIRALRTVPNLSIHYGHFLTHPVMRPLSTHPTSAVPPFYVRVIDQGQEITLPLAPYDAASPLCFVPVWNTEEKGSDVNLATHLLWDGVKEEYDIAIVVSNDSDLAEPVNIVKNELGKRIIILNPHRERPSAELQKIADQFIDIRARHLVGSQFPAILTDGRGEFEKPSTW